MTGFGRCEDTINGRDIIVEIKSVNHRYFEFSSRITRGYGFLDEKLKSYLQSQIFRGKIDVYVSIETLEDTDSQVLVNHSLAAGYVNALHELAQRYGLRDDISVSTVSRYSDIFTVHKAPDDEEIIWNAVKEVTNKALDSFIRMREAEGARLKADVLQRAETILETVGKIEERSPQAIVEYHPELKETLSDMPNDS